MIKIRRSKDRGRSPTGPTWLDTRFSFSFADYYDPQQMGFRALRVINEDRIAPSSGFGTHPHRDMEIVTYVLSGGLAHRDSMDHIEVIHPGEVQRMTAGTGVTHSEYNHSPDEEVHLLQIWVLPERDGLTPGYEQRAFPLGERRNRLTLLGSRDGREGSVTIHQDVDLHGGLLDPGAETSFHLREGRHAWLQLIRGSIEVNGDELRAGDALAASEEPRLDIHATNDAEFLLFDLA